MKITILLTLMGLACTANGASILLAGFDGNNTYEIPDGSGGFQAGGVFQSAGDKYIRDPHQSTAATTAGFTAELYMFSNVAKEMQWGGAGQTSTGAWGSGVLGPFSPAPNTANGTNVYTAVDTTTLEFRVTNGGSDTITLEHIFFAARRDSSTLSGDSMTVSYLSGDLAGSGNTVVNFVASTANTGYEVDLSTILTDTTLAAGESATFSLVSAAGTSRLKIDDIGMSGTIIPEPSAALLGGIGALLLLRRRRD